MLPTRQTILSRSAPASASIVQTANLSRKATRNVACSFAKAGTASNVLLDSLRAEPAYAQQLQDMPAFGTLLDCHMLLHDLVNEQAPLERAKTKVSDEQVGVTPSGACCCVLFFSACAEHIVF
jgi:hypothetical protein